jgi:hypothetical protein
MKPGSTSNDGNKRRRQSLAIDDLSEEQRQAIAVAEVPPEYAHLDEELRPEPDRCPERPVAQNDQRPREAGQMRGKIWIAEDFDAPDPEIEKLFNEGDEP